MCGRVRCTLHPPQILAAAGFPSTGALDHSGTVDGDVSQFVSTHQLDRYRPSYNVAPGAYLPVVRLPKDKGKEGEEKKMDELVPVIDCMKWGLIPSFTKSSEKPDHYRMFNARSESIKEKASFRRLIPKNRCLVVVEGFYEWKKDGSKRQPYYIHLKDHRPLAFAALYDAWKNSEGETLYTFTILTTCASSALQWLHDRMPVILGDNSSTNIWLKSSTEKIESLLRPYEAPDLVWYPVSTEVGKLSFNGPECIKEIQIKSTCVKPISKFFAKKTDEMDQNEDVEKSSWESPPDSAKVKEDLDALKEVRDAGKPVVNFPVFDNEVSKCEDRGIKRGVGDQTPILGTNPVKKEKVAKNTGDRQSSLLSYFGKK